MNVTHLIRSGLITATFATLSIAQTSATPTANALPLPQTWLAVGNVALDDKSPTGLAIEGTRVFVTSSSVDLKAVMDAQKHLGTTTVMKVVDRGTGILEIASAKPTAPTLAISDLAIGKEAKISVTTRPWCYAWIYLTHQDDTRFEPLGQYGTWFLGVDARLIDVAKSDATSTATTRFVVPPIPALVGTTFVAQAVHGDARMVELTNPASTAVRR